VKMIAAAAQAEVPKGEKEKVGAGSRG